MNFGNFFRVLEHDPSQSMVVVLLVGAAMLVFWGWTAWFCKTRWPIRKENRPPFIKLKMFGQMIGVVGTIVSCFALFVMWVVWVFPVEMITSGNINMGALTATEGLIFIAVGGFFAFRLWQIGTGRWPPVNMLASVFAIIMAVSGIGVGAVLIHGALEPAMRQFVLVAVAALTSWALLIYMTIYAFKMAIRSR